jgi:hypothetical protein
MLAASPCFLTRAGSEDLSRMPWCQCAAIARSAFRGEVASIVLALSVQDVRSAVLGDKQTRSHVRRISKWDLRGDRNSGHCDLDIADSHA